MKQSNFDTLTQGTGARYFPFKRTGPYYELNTINITTGSVNNGVHVSVYDQDGKPALGVWVRHSFGKGGPDEMERFPFMGNPVDFWLGGGSHYSEPADPPDRIAVEGGASDEVHVGNANIIGFSHIDCQMVFNMTSDSTKPSSGGFWEWLRKLFGQ